jgi:6-phosphogluconolactonase/glucosamine-6-phosphate isomerase/deaminase
MQDFVFEPSDFVPFKDREVMERVRRLSGRELEKHPNPDLKIKVTLNPHPIFIADMFTKIKESDEQNKRVVMVLPNPEPDTYIPVAELINYHRVNCRNVYIFAQDEWADQDGHIAPVTYRAGFAYSLLKYFVMLIDEDLRMPMENVVYPTDQNISDYSSMITETGEGGADVIYTSPGWTGHIAFIDPVDEFLTDNIDEYLKQDARIVTLHPLTVAQNSLHGVFGQSGDIGNVPPKAATIGPVDIVRARERIEIHALLTNGTFSSWQRMVSRLILHGPVTPMVPSSIFQLLKTQVYVSEAVAAPFECWEKMGY